MIEQEGEPVERRERDVASRGCLVTARSQLRASQSGEATPMYRINYLPPEQMPPHERDFRREQPTDVPALKVLTRWR